MWNPEVKVYKIHITISNSVRFADQMYGMYTLELL